jgi:hypothetical protein
VLDKALPLVREKTHVSIAAWVTEQNALGHVCQSDAASASRCGPTIGRSARRASFPTATAAPKGEPRTSHQDGLLTVRETADALGIREGILHRLDAEVSAGTPREGGRFFTLGDVDTLRNVLEERRAKREGNGAACTRPVSDVAATGSRFGVSWV